jgi:arginine decarboxylase
MGARKEGIKQKVRGWNHHDSSELYGIDDWGNGYFRINKNGDVTVRLEGSDGNNKDISIVDLVRGLSERGTTVPVLFRFRVAQPYYGAK